MSSRRHEAGTLVEFTAKHLESLPLGDQRRFAGRVGKISGYRMGSDWPIVTFPKVGRLVEQKLFEVNPDRLIVSNKATSLASPAGISNSAKLKPR